MNDVETLKSQLPYKLACIARSIVYNFGEEWVAPFWEAYGVTEVDHAKIAFFRLIDEVLCIAG